ncbi:MAG: RDD family protein [Candidatus Hermodarchaeota archaeon]
MSYQPAGALKRLIAFIIDGIILGVVNQILSWIMAIILPTVFGDPLSIISDPNIILTDPEGFIALVMGMIIGAILLAAVVEFLFWVIVPSVMDGQTIGKKIMGLQIRKLMPDGSTESTGGMWVTHLLRWIGLLLWFSGILYCLDCILVLVTEKKQRIGDFIAGTVVVD